MGAVLGLCSAAQVRKLNFCVVHNKQRKVLSIFIKSSKLLLAKDLIRLSMSVEVSGVTIITDFS